MKARRTASSRCSITIAGFDPSGGAGVLRDLEELRGPKPNSSAFAAVTALTVQDGVRYRGHEAVDPGLLARQLELLAERFDIGFVKIGMLATADIVHVVARFLGTLDTPTVVLDPVLGASAGGALLDDEGVDLLRLELLPRVDLLTPNAPELLRLLQSGEPIPEDPEALNDWLDGARRELKVALVLTGGHLPAPLTGTDLLATEGGVRAYPAQRVAAHGAHGTGCTFSSALLAARAMGRSWEDALPYAKERVLSWIESGRAGSEEGNSESGAAAADEGRG